MEEGWRRGGGGVEEGWGRDQGGIREGWGMEEDERGRRSTTLRSLESREACVPWVSSQPIRTRVAPGPWGPRDPPHSCREDTPLTPWPLTPWPPECLYNNIVFCMMYYINLKSDRQPGRPTAHRGQTGRLPESPVSPFSPGGPGLPGAHGSVIPGGTIWNIEGIIHHEMICHRRVRVCAAHIPYPLHRRYVCVSYPCLPWSPAGPWVPGVLALRGPHVSPLLLGCPGLQPPAPLGDPWPPVAPGHPSPQEVQLQYPPGRESVLTPPWQQQAHTTTLTTTPPSKHPTLTTPPSQHHPHNNTTLTPPPSKHPHPNNTTQFYLISCMNAWSNLI